MAITAEEIQILLRIQANQIAQDLDGVMRQISSKFNQIVKEVDKGITDAIKPSNEMGAKVEKSLNSVVKSSAKATKEIGNTYGELRRELEAISAGVLIKASALQATDLARQRTELQGINAEYNYLLNATEKLSSATASVSRAMAGLQAPKTSFEAFDTSQTTAALNGVVSQVESTSSSLGEKLQTGISAGLFAIQHPLQAAALAVTTVQDKIQTGIASAAEFARHPIESLGNAVTVVADKIRESFGPTVMSGLGAFDRGLSALGQKMQSGIVGAAQTAGSAIKTAFSNIGPILKSAASSVGGFAASMGKVAGGKALSGIAKIPGLFGKVAMSGTGIKQVVGGLSSIFDKVGGAVQRFTRIFSLMLIRMAARQIIRAAGEEIKNLAAYSNTFNAAMSEMQSSVQYAGRALVTALAPAIEALVPLVTWITNLIAQLATSVGKLIAALTGKSSFVQAKKQVTDFASANKDSTKELKEANKELQKYLAGFDELNVISIPDASSAGGGGGAGDAANVSDMFETVEIEGKFKDLAETIKNIMSRVFEPMRAAWETHGKGVIDAWTYALTTVWDVIKQMGATWLSVWENGTGERVVGNILLLVQEIGMWIGDIAGAWGRAWETHGENAVQSQFDMLNAILELIHSISQSFRAAWNNEHGEAILGNIMQIFTNINETVKNLAVNLKLAWEENGVGDRIAEGVLTSIEKIFEAVEKVTNAIKEWAKDVEFGPLLESLAGMLEKLWPMIEKIGNFLVWLWDNIIGPALKDVIETLLPFLIDTLGNLFQIIGGIFDLIVGIFTLDFEKIKEGLLAIFGGIADFFNNLFGMLWEAILGIVDRIKQAFQQTWENIKTAVSNIWETIKGVFSGIGEWFAETFGNAWENIKNAFSKVGEFFEGVWEGIKGVFKGIADWFGNIFSNAWSAVKKAFTAGGEIFSGIKDAIANVLKGMVNGLIRGINWVIRKPFDFINSAFNTLKRIKIFGVEIFGWLPTIPVPQIPELAHGGVAYDETLAVIGEYANARSDPEIVAPQSLMLATVSKAFGPVYELLALYLPQLLTLIEERDDGVYLDGQKVSQELFQHLQRESRVRGVPLS